MLRLAIRIMKVKKRGTKGAGSRVRCKPPKILDKNKIPVIIVRGNS
jgi:hypothetical protein